MDRPSTAPQGFLLLGSAEPATPVLIAVPHAGRDYPLPLRARATVPVDALAAMEDRHAELLVSDAVEAGISALIATRARCWIDLNRDEREVDPAMIFPPPPPSEVISTVKSRGGLGVIPRRLPGGGEILRSKIGLAELRDRIAQDHRPWHAALDAGLRARVARFGAAMLIDCHSMPPIRHSQNGAGRPRIVIGDRHGRSAAPGLVERLVAIAESAGFGVARNAPYAGGHTLDRHGRPTRGIHAVQIEIDRSLYLAPDLRAPGPGLPAIRALVAQMALAMADELGTNALPCAAE